MVSVNTSWVGHMSGWWMLPVVPAFAVVGMGLHLTWGRPFQQSPVAILERHHAMGEVERDEYLIRKQDLEE